MLKGVEIEGKPLAIAREVLPGTRRYTQHTVYELAECVRERDLITYEHSRRVAIYATRLARFLGWSRRASRDLALAGLVHDLGKTWMTNSLLHKESALSADEWAEMQRHPGIAARILQAYGAPETMIQTVLHHHERFDGRGYPDHLAGVDIPLGARVLTVVDVFDALTTARPYKCAVPAGEVRDMIECEAGSHFDPHVAAAFVRLVDGTAEFLLPARIEPLSTPDTQRVWYRHDMLGE